MQGRGHAWTEDERRMVVGLLQAHLSYRKIAHKLGITRNAVIGRISRDDRLHAQYRPNEPRPRPKRLPRVRHPEPFDCDDVEPIGPPRPYVPGELKPIAELRRDDCRWPVEAANVTGGHLFCGRPRAGDHTLYCRQHFRMARQGGRAC